MNLLEEETVENVACSHCGGSNAECLLCLGGGPCGGHADLAECKEYEAEQAEIHEPDIGAAVARLDHASSILARFPGAEAKEGTVADALQAIAEARLELTGSE